MEYWNIGFDGMRSFFLEVALAGSGQFDQRRNFLVTENCLKQLWERFVTAINSIGQLSKIVVKNHSHQA